MALTVFSTDVNKIILHIKRPPKKASGSSEYIPTESKGLLPLLTRKPTINVIREVERPPITVRVKSLAFREDFLLHFSDLSKWIHSPSLMPLPPRV